MRDRDMKRLMSLVSQLTFTQRAKVRDELFRQAELTQALAPVLAPDVVLCTDGSSAMAAAARQIGVEHHALNMTSGARTQGPWHIQNVNAYHGRLKAWMRRFHGVATKYLASYLGWFRAMDRFCLLASQPASRLALAIGSSRHP